MQTATNCESVLAYQFAVLLRTDTHEFVVEFVKMMNQENGGAVRVCHRDRSRCDVLPHHNGRPSISSSPYVVAAFSSFANEGDERDRVTN